MEEIKEIKDQYIPTCFEYIPWYFEIMVPFSLIKKKKKSQPASSPLSNATKQNTEAKNCV